MKGVSSGCISIILIAEGLVCNCEFIPLVANDVHMKTFTC